MHPIALEGNTVFVFKAIWYTNIFKKVVWDKVLGLASFIKLWEACGDCYPIPFICINAFLGTWPQGISPLTSLSSYFLIWMPFCFLRGNSSCSKGIRILTSLKLEENHICTEHISAKGGLNCPVGIVLNWTKCPFHMYSLLCTCKVIAK